MTVTGLYKAGREVSLAVILPCHNEAGSIARVVADFGRELPTARIYVLDNNSSDGTAALAAGAGALVITERQQGKGNAVRRAFSEIEADLYIIADGDGTYDTRRASEMAILLLDEHLDMVVGVRRATQSGAYRAGHRWGNRLFNAIVRTLFGNQFNDIFSGYRIFSRRFVKSFPALSTGFEIETEMSVHAIHLRLPTAEIETDYFERGDGSASKLKTYRDGFRILLTVLKLLKAMRPLALFSALAAIFFVIAAALGMPILWHFIETHTVLRIPTTVGVVGLVVLGAISLITGIILDSIMLAETSYKRLFYLSLPPTRRNDA
ncbi:MAG: glycosyltransferase [Ferrovibrio sp.]|uniref:glycosyltransferase n=1 Tax=Ferrovibrio sp. TaxID=1917215 RepID=UPI00260F8C49|nr:glycosyltransferase [Ferrovibrio sp.]MCW0233887.1 glycosyltransferase [Ferrovibrio sp.]